MSLTQEVKEYRNKNQITIAQLYLQMIRKGFEPSFDTVSNWARGKVEVSEKYQKGVERFLKRKKKEN
jgi:hypothetical protein